MFQNRPHHFGNKIILIGIILIALNLPWITAQDTIRILFIGNSYTFANLGTDTPELPLRLTEMGNLYGKTIIADFSGAGGLALEKHWNSGKAAAKIRSGHYNYVVMQEQSLGTLYKSDNFENYAQKFTELIVQNNARPLFYMTWARQNRLSMIDTISREYIKMAQELDALIAPCGFAWDMTVSQFPGIKLYWEDNSHPRPEGVLLNTFVFYSTLFGDIPNKPLYNFEYKGARINEDTVLILMQIAFRASQEINYQLGDQK
jgi:hypothetical protein